MDRKEFISQSMAAGAGMILPNYPFSKKDEPYLMTVTGKISFDQPGIVLPHEHITTDFTGAEKVIQPQYKPGDAFNIILPDLKKLKSRGVSLIAECTPNFIGRDVRLLKKLSIASGVKIITNTGYYSAVEQKYLPQHAFDENADQLAVRFLKEWTDGIDGTGIRPGFIKLGVDNGPLKDIEKKLIRAAAATHLKSGLKIAIHTGDAEAAKEEFSILTEEGIASEGFIWVHAQNDGVGDTHVELAKKGCWISLDGVNARAESIATYVKHLTRLKENGLLNRVLLSHDDGRAVIKNENGSVSLRVFDNGNIIPYQGIFTHLKPALLQHGFTENDLSLMMVQNPLNAYSIKVCKV